MNDSLKGYPMRIITSVLLFTALAMGGCTASHTYGPYMGRVVDKETNEPIDGAVVLMTFFVEGPMDVSSFADAVEVLTDEKGEFLVPPQRLVKFRPMHEWEDAYVVIFKPGYGAFPRHKSSLVENGRYVANKHLIIKLPKLKTRQERLDNLDNLRTSPSVPDNKKELFIRANNNEFDKLGL